MGQNLEFTGERFIPGTAGEIWHEHWHRYHFAAPLVAGLDVLDVACGEGYGSALLASRAAKVTGADIAPAAWSTPGSGMRARESSSSGRRTAPRCRSPMRASTRSVSFETIEHIAAQEAFLDEIRRVLRPDGLMVLSCPNKSEYSDRRGFTNEFHVRELYRPELEQFVTSRFRHALWYGQRSSFYSVVWAEQGDSKGEIFEVAEASAKAPSPGHTRPLYFIVIASASQERLAAIAPRVSVLADRDEWVRADYEKVDARPAGDASARARSRCLRRAGKRGARRPHSGSTPRTRAPTRTNGLASPGMIERRQHEIARRASFKWWVALPLRRAWLGLEGQAPLELGPAQRRVKITGWWSAACVSRSTRNGLDARERGPRSRR
jgi:SAM-dependent methyltransferase